MNLIEWNRRPDPMMEELRQIRDQIGAEVSQLNAEDRTRYYSEKTKEAAASIGMVLVPHPTIPFAQMMVPKADVDGT